MLRTKHHALRGLLCTGLRLGSVALLALFMLASATHAKPGDKVQVCHRPPGNPGNFHVIEVSANAVASHLAHGDNLVEPEVCDGVDNDCDGVIDNHLSNLGRCTVGEGACADTAPNECRAGVLVCTAWRPRGVAALRNV